MISLQEKSVAVDGTFRRFNDSQLVLDALLQSLNNQRHTNILCDVILVVQGHEFPAHKGILAANSNYFMAMFTTNMAEKQQARVILKEISPSAVGNILDYIYTGTLKLDEENVREMLEASNFLLVNSIKDECCEFLERILSVENCLLIISLADEFYCSELHQKATSLLYKEFLSVARHEDFMKLALEEVTELFSSDEIQIDDEYQLFESMTRWLLYDLPQRKQFLLQLMSLVRLHFVQPGQIEQSLIYKEIAGNLGKDELNWKIKVTESPRKSYSNIAAVIVVGGVNKYRILDSVLCYLPTEDKWCSLGSMNVPRWKLNVVSSKSGVLAVGGLQEVSTVQQELPYMENYDIRTNQWKTVKTPNLPFPVDSSSYNTISLGNEIMFIKNTIGGDDEPSCVCLQEIKGEKRWVSLAPLPDQRSGNCCVATKSQVFVIGGSRQSHHASNGDTIVQLYSRNEDKWTSAPAMTEPRFHASAAVIDDKIYVIGGCHGQQVLATAEVYDPKTKEWSTIESLKTPRMNAGIAVHDGKVWVFGGMNGPRGDIIDSVEVYDPKVNQWRICASMPEKRKDFMCCSTEIAYKTVAATTTKEL